MATALVRAGQAKVATVSQVPIRPPPGLELPEAAASCAPRRCLQLDTLLSDTAGSSVSTSAAGTPSSSSNDALPGSDRLPPLDLEGWQPYVADEPAYITWTSHLPMATAPSRDAAPESASPMHVEHSLLGIVGALSCEAGGSRRVQDALDQASDKMRKDILKEFHGHAVKAMCDPHANHVLQKCISIMPPESLQFMIDELLEKEGLAGKVARHRYGGRIVQHLLKWCSASQVSGLAGALMQETIPLACHNFGTFPVQHLLQFGTQEQQRQLVQEILKDVVTICQSKVGDGVIAAAMEHADAEDKLLVARTVLLEPGLLVHLAQCRHGHVAVLRMLHVLDGQERVQAYAKLADDISSVRTSRFGRRVAEHMEVTTLHKSTGSSTALNMTS